MKILLTTDGSESAQATLDFLIHFPLPAVAEVTLITVIEKELYKSSKRTTLSDEQQKLLEQTKDMLQNEAETLLAKDTEKLQAAGINCSTLIHSGHPARQIVKAAKTIGADLVIVGSHGWTGVKRFLLGSVSDQVLAYAPCSVLIVRTDESGSIGIAPSTQAKRLNLLLAYDDSEPAKQAVSFTASLALDERDEITLLSVLPLITQYRQDIKQKLSWIWKEKKKLAQQSLDATRNEVKWDTPHVNSHLSEAADVSQEILDMATKINCNLIVLGYKGKGAIEKFLLGSVTPRIAHHAPCSVLAVRTSAKK